MIESPADVIVETPLSAQLGMPQTGIGVGKYFRAMDNFPS